MKKKLAALLSGLRHFRGNSLLVRGLLVTFLAVVLVLSIVLTMAYNISTTLVDDSVLEMNRVISTRALDSISTVLDESARIGASISLDDNTRRFMLSENYPSELIKALAGDCSNYGLIFDYIHSIYIYSEKNDYLISPFYTGTAAGYVDTSWREGYASISEDRVCAVARVRDGGYPYFLTVMIPYYFFQGQKSGAVLVNIDMDKLDKLLLGIGNLAEQTITVTDESNRVLYCNNRRFFSGQAAENDILRKALAAIGTTFVHTDFGGERTVVTSARLRNRAWNLTSALPLAYYDSTFLKLQGQMQQLVILVVIVGIVLTIWLAVRSYLPVRGIITTLEESEHLPPAPAHPQNEADYIRQAISASLKSNQSMKTELDNRLHLLHEAQASALQAQITPHFLSNTLDAIRWGAVEMGGGENEVSRMLTVLSALLRTSLDMESALVTVETEIAHCLLYLDIMRYRYSTDLDVRFDIPDELMKTPIVKLTFQPLLENAIYHGLRPKKMQGSITVTAFKEEDKVVLRFKDSGVGIDDEKTNHLNLEMDSEAALTGSHIGMHNVNQRIKLLFGVEYGLRVCDSHGTGTIIELVIPATDS